MYIVYVYDNRVLLIMLMYFHRTWVQRSLNRQTWTRGYQLLGPRFPLCLKAENGDQQTPLQKKYFSADMMCRQHVTCHTRAYSIIFNPQVWIKWVPPNQASFRNMTWVSLKIVNLQTCGYVLRNEYVCGFICGMPCFSSTHICCFRSSLTDTKPWQSPWQRLKHRTAMLPALAKTWKRCQ